MAEEVAALQIRLEATAARFERDMQRATRSMQAATGRMERQASALDKRLSETGARFGLNIPTRATAITAAIAGIGLAFREVVKAGEQMRSLEGRFAALTGSAERASALVESVFSVSARTGDTLDTVGSLQSRFLLAAEEIGATDQEVARFTESLLKLGRIGGATSTEISNGTTQLSQALAGGVVRAEEFNSIIENTPFIAKALADALDVSLGGLREMVLDGELLADDVFAAILGQSEKIDAQFQKIPQTSEQAWTRATNAMTLVLSQLDDAVGVSSTWVSILNSAAGAAERIAAGLKEANAGRAVLNELGQRERLREVDDRILSARSNIVRYQAGGYDQSNLVAAQDKLRALLDEREALRSELGLSGGGGPRRGGVRGQPSTPPEPSSPYAADPEYTQRMLDAYSGYGRGAPGAGPLTPIDVLTPTEPTARGGRGSSSRSADEVDRAIERLQDMTREMVQQAEAAGLTDEALSRYNATVEAGNIIADASLSATPEQRAELERLGEAYVEAAVSADDLRRAEDERADALANAERMNELLVDSISGAIVNADSFEDAIKRLTLALVEMGIKAAILGEGPLASLFGGGSSGGGAPGWFGLLGTAAKAALGGAFGGGFGDAGTIASGGSSFSPALYANGTPFHPGGPAIVGERGPELLLDMPRGSRVIPNDRLGGLGGGGIVVKNYGADISVDTSGLETVITARTNTAVGVAVRSVERSIASGGSGIDRALTARGQSRSGGGLR